MTPQPLSGFRALETHHCVTGAMRHVYEFHDAPISEGLLLGLGEGVGFVYWHMKGTLPFFGGRGNVGRPGEEGLERTAGRRTGVIVEVLRTASAAKAEKALLDLLGAGEPVMLLADMGYLPYLRLPQGFHFGGHAVVAAGYDLAARQVLIADRDGALHPVSLADLAQARGSQHKPFPPGNQWYTYDFSGRRAPRPEEVREAIRANAGRMLNPPIANLGVAGIRTAAARTRQWPRALGPDELRAACFQVFLFIDAAGGTGGGIFRIMHSRFLKEAAALTGDARLVAIGDEMHAIGEEWQVVAHAFRKAHAAPDPADLLPAATDRMVGIAEREEAAWQELHRLSAG